MIKHQPRYYEEIPVTKDGLKIYLELMRKQMQRTSELIYEAELRLQKMTPVCKTKS